jgi:hypothetical protein
MMLLPNIFYENWRSDEPENNSMTEDRHYVLNAPAILASTSGVKSNYPGFFKENLYEMYFSHTVIHDF